MGELASRIRAKFKRRASASPSIETPTDSNRHSPPAGRPRSLAGSQRPASFAERLPSSRSNHTDKWYAANEHVLSPLIPDQEPSAAPGPLQQPPLPSTVTPAPTPAPAPVPTPEPKQEAVPARDAKEDAGPAARGQSCPGLQPAEAADTGRRDPRPEPELQPELQPEPEPAQAQPAQAQQEPEPRSEPEPKLPATMSASRSPAGLAAARADSAPVPDEQELSRHYININGNDYSVAGVGKKPGEQSNDNQQSLPASAEALAPATSAPADSAEQQQRQPSDSGPDRADQRARDNKMGKDQQPVLPSIHEHPQDIATDTTDSTAITTDDDDLPRCSYPASPGTDSGMPTPKAPTVVFSSASRSSDPDTTTHALRTTAETQANQTNSSTSSVPARHSLVLPLASSATEMPGAARRLSSTSHSNANSQQRSPPAPPSAAAEMQAIQQLLQALLRGGARAEQPLGVNGDQLPAMPNKRKVWVRRPSASATLIHIGETDVVDDVRDLILRKYANSLGRQFDSPDLTLRIIPREHQRERALSPDEHMIRTLEAYFPGGQTVEEALLIDVPLRRTPRPSPRAGGAPHLQMMNTAVYYGPPSEDRRPPENGTDYFGPAVVNGVSLANGIVAHPHSISVINTGQIPQIPSPGGTRTRAYRDRPDRPRLGRQHTSSPTVLNLLTAHQQAAQLGVNANVEQAAASPPTAPPMPTPPASDATMQVVATPPAGAPARVASPRPNAARQKKPKKSADHPKLPLGVFSGGVPPINVLIVEDNPINLRLLEVFVKRLKVRWQTAVNGREAVDKWRQGGFHLVLMDIQLPVMSGLDATREIRRLERVNSIGVFPSRRAPNDVKSPPKEEDRLANPERFKSPVIIVALTASSLQSDRHEALAAGCNDFLTKPVNFVWFEKKIMEWGCMQALIDYDGWRQWKKEYALQHQQDGESKKSSSSKTKGKKNRASSASTVSAGPSNSAAL